VTNITDEFRSEIGRKLKELLENSHKSQSDLAKEISWGGTVISKVVNGKYHSKNYSEIVVAIISKLGFKPEEILERSELDILLEKEVEIPDHVDGIVDLGFTSYRKSLTSIDSELKESVEKFEEIAQGALDLNAPNVNESIWRDGVWHFYRALDSGNVKLLRYQSNVDLASELRKQYDDYNLRHVTVVDLPRIQYDEQSPYRDISLLGTELVSMAAVDMLDRLKLGVENKVGLSGGLILHRFVELQSPSIAKYPDTKWIPILTSRNRAYEPSYHSADNIVYGLKKKYPSSKARYLPFVESEFRDVFFDAAEKDAKVEIEHDLGDRVIESSMDLGYLYGASAVFMSITSYENLDSEFAILGSSVPRLLCDIRNELKSNENSPKPVAFYGASLIDHDGNEIESNCLSRNLFGIPLKWFKVISRQKRPVVLLAASYRKNEAVYAAVKARLCNSLVITADIAEYLLERCKQD
jgi:transcriptional regulator with XRE-family HTH domain